MAVLFTTYSIMYTCLAQHIPNVYIFISHVTSQLASPSKTLILSLLQYLSYFKMKVFVMQCKLQIVVCTYIYTKRRNRYTTKTFTILIKGSLWCAQYSVNVLRHHSLLRECQNHMCVQDGIICSYMYVTCSLFTYIRHMKYICVLITRYYSPAIECCCGVSFSRYTIS